MAVAGGLVGGLMQRRPQSSPWAPALGGMATADIPVSVFSQWARRSMSSRAPCAVEIGARGWRSAKPANLAIFSLRRGLCFMVHDPRG